MNYFYLREGDHVVSWGVTTNRGDVVVPPGQDLVFRALPSEALSPPVAGARWNLTTSQWDLPEVSPDLAARRARYKRDRLLNESDWVRLRAYDRGEPVPPEWLAYRQALRDITEQPGFPYEIEWPQRPES